MGIGRAIAMSQVTESNPVRLFCQSSHILTGVAEGCQREDVETFNDIQPYITEGISVSVCDEQEYNYSQAQHLTPGAHIDNPIKSGGRHVG
jgi:hypothetical protein